MQKKTIHILSIESSCDDTGAAVLKNNEVLSNVIAGQEIHAAYGGVVPELASRAHQQNIVPVVDQALKMAGITKNQLDAIAFTQGPGLMGSLLVGTSFAKSLSIGLNLPLIPVNHMQAHVLAHFIKEDGHQEPPYPFLCMTISGGHTQILKVVAYNNFKILGETIDDAVGEAFDKTAKLLNLGYPGGPRIDEIAQKGNPEFVRFPRALNKKGNFNFSFSGLKTSIRNYLLNHNSSFINNHLADITASVQAAIVDSLVFKTINYARKRKSDKIIIAGGVSANNLLRKSFKKQADKIGIDVVFPALEYCMDNAAMIGAAAVDKYKRKEFADLSLNAFSKKGLRFI